jgi:hypothetical protein
LTPHHDQARFCWHATAPDQSEPAYVCFDVVVAADDQIHQVYEFIDRTPVTDRDGNQQRNRLRTLKSQPSRVSW